MVLLQPCDFDASFNNGLGYRRSFVRDYLKQVEHQITGTANLSGPKHPRYFEFEWSLNLSTEKYHALYAMWFNQNNAINTYSDTIEYRIFLRDGRLILPVNEPRSRAAVTNIDINDAPIPPIGFSYIWPLFSILITSLDEEAFMPDKNLWKVRMTAREIQVLNTAFDII